MAPRRKLTVVEPGEELRATDGRVPGRRGRATRGRLLEAIAALLTRTSYRTVRVIDIAREAGTSPATFYQYFPDVEHAILVLAEQTAEDGVAVAELARGDWRGEQGFRTARALVEGFMEYWEAHRAVFRVIDLATEEGDLRFQGLRTRALHPLTEVLTTVIDDGRKRGRTPMGDEPLASAAVLVSMLAHVSAHRYGMEFWGIRTADLVESLTRVVYWSVSGRRAPA
jgi:AcrR family transcriptional regulator